MGHGLLHQRVAIVTGAGSGIGRQIAREFAAEGASVVLLDQDGAAVERVAAEVQTQGHQAHAYVLDVSDYEQYGEVVRDVVDHYGRLDILVNNAAIVRYGSLLDGSLETWRAVLRVNLEAVYVGSKLAARYITRQGSGRIISLSSVQALAATSDVGPYNAAKAGIIGLTKSMAVELAPYHIAVNAIAPGFIRTPMSVVDGVDETTTDEFYDLYIAKRRIPMARPGLPDDVAGAATFLASDLCRYMTGHILVVDGGLTSTF